MFEPWIYYKIGLNDSKISGFYNVVNLVNLANSDFILTNEWEISKALSQYLILALYCIVLLDNHHDNVLTRTVYISVTH